MDNFDIVKKVKVALDLLIEFDDWLLVQDLSERSITHKLAERLQFLFQDYDVDCEYNGDIDNDANNRKHIHILWEKLHERGLLRQDERENREEPVSRSVFPDIIIHERGSNEDNLCVIELKKSTNRLADEYDDLKLKAYTSPAHGNHLKYQLGIFITVVTKQEKPIYDMRFYEGGDPCELEGAEAPIPA